MKNIVNKSIIHQKAEKRAKLKILLIGNNKSILKELLKSGDDYYSYDKIEGVFKIDQTAVSENLSYEFDFVLSLDPYKHLKYTYILNNKLKYPLIFIHSEVPSGKKELLIQAAFELEKHINIVLDEGFKNKLCLSGAYYSNIDINWRDYFYELLVKRS